MYPQYQPQFAGAPQPQQHPYAGQYGVPPGVPPMNAMAMGGVPQNWSQTPMPQQPATQPMQSEIEQQLNGWLKERGVDLNQFGGNVTQLLDGLYEGAQKAFDLEDQMKAAKNQPAPVDPQAADVNWREYEKWLTTNEQGEIVPVENSPVPIPWAAVKQANEVAQKVKQFRYDPEGFLKQNVESFVEEKARAIAEQKWQEFQAQQAQENSLNQFVEQHKAWMFHDGDPKKGTTEFGQKLIESVQAAEEAGVRPDKVLDFAWRDFQGSFLKDALTQKQREAQQAQAGLNQQGQYDPSMDQQFQQPRQPNGQFAPKANGQQFAPNQQQAQQPAPQPQYSPAALQSGQQFQPTTAGGNGTPQNTGQFQAPATGPAQMPAQPAYQQPAGQAAPPQQSFLQESGFGAALEPSTRSGEFAHASVNEGDDFDGLETIMDELANRAGIDVNAN